MNIWRFAQLSMVVGIMAGAAQHMVGEIIFIATMLALTLFHNPPAKEPRND